ncbi:hypothetical protein CN307_32200 [Bacillus cereus]|uniref:Uncharacterized protein n=1 Tax=Bacillus cereus TaxID=1396 RepID=A0A2A8ZQ51_BACCE|nr:hypothetical protein CN307_32200 [Bacillus cereus]
MPGFLFYPSIRRAVRPSPQNSAEAEKLGEGSTARKIPAFVSIVRLFFSSNNPLSRKANIVATVP